MRYVRGAGRWLRRLRHDGRVRLGATGGGGPTGVAQGTAAGGGVGGEGGKEAGEEPVEGGGKRIDSRGTA